MKTIRFLLSLFALISSLRAESPPASEAEPKHVESAVQFDSTATAHVVVDVAMFVVSEKRALTMVDDLRNPAKINEAAQRLEAMVAKKEAELLAWPHLTSISGQRMHSETIDEFRYPTEFDPPQGFPIGNDEAEPISGPDAKPKLVGKRATPTAFETRNLGPQLDIAPVFSPDGERIVLSVTFTWAQLAGWNTFNGQIAQPRFVSLKSMGNFVLHSGSRVLLDVHRLEMPANHVAILILRGTMGKHSKHVP